MDNLTTEGKAQLAIAFQNLTAALDSTGACLFSTFGMGADELAQMVSTLTGVPYPTEELLRVGERIWNMERLWNLKAGLTAKDDTLPERLLRDPLPDGGAKGKVNRLGQMLPEYYQLRGWDKVGVPTEKKLKELALA
jgi:aldehyde:ferredoxin oxidoreductase